MEFISNNISPEDLMKFIPPVHELVLTYHLEIETALYVSRPFLHLRYVKSAFFETYFKFLDRSIYYLFFQKLFRYSLMWQNSETCLKEFPILKSLL